MNGNTEGKYSIIKEKWSLANDEVSGALDMLLDTKASKTSIDRGRDDR